MAFEKMKEYLGFKNLDVTLTKEQYGVLKEKNLIPEGPGVYTFENSQGNMEVGFKPVWGPGAMKGLMLFTLYAPRIFEALGHGIIPDLDLGGETIPAHTDVTHVPGYDITTDVPALTETTNIFYKRFIGYI